MASSPAGPPRMSEAAEAWNAAERTTSVPALEAFITRFKDTFFAVVTKYYWGDDIGKNFANCDGCGSQWIRKKRLQSAHSRRTFSACMTCTATLRNGSKIAGMRITMVPQQTAVVGRGIAYRSVPVWFARAPGIAFQFLFTRFAVKDTRQVFDGTYWACA